MIKIERNNLGKISLQYLSRIKECKHRKLNPIISYYIENIDSIVLALPSEYSKINGDFKKVYNYNEESFNRFKSYMANQYKIMCIKHGSWLAKEIGINTCPYCNRQYTFTIDKHKKVRPQFDHFLSKSKYPHLALSFYNLIPCCQTCNQLKSDDTKELLYPYSDGFDDKYLFEVNHKDFILDNIPVSVKLEPIRECDEFFRIKCENTKEVFALEELYQEHSDYIEEIIIKAYSYNEDYYEGLIDDFSKMGKTVPEIHRLIFGNYIDKANNEKRPLSKLTSDLLNQMEIKE